MTKINILGQEYDYKEIPAKEDPKLGDNDGYCDDSSKIICINNDYNTSHPACIGDVDHYIRKVKRHEIIHAFLAESGLDRYKDDELIVSWLANQFPKLQVAFLATGAV